MFHHRGSSTSSLADCQVRDRGVVLFTVELKNIWEMLAKERTGGGDVPVVEAVRPRAVFLGGCVRRVATGSEIRLLLQ